MNLSTYTHRFQSVANNLSFPTFATSLNNRVSNNAQITRLDAGAEFHHDAEATISRPQSPDLTSATHHWRKARHEQSFAIPNPTPVILLPLASTLPPPFRTLPQGDSLPSPVAINPPPAWEWGGWGGLPDLPYLQPSTIYEPRILRKELR